MAAQKVAFFFFSHLVVHLLRLRQKAFLSHLYIKTIILPRQVRDKHRENTQIKMDPFLAPGSAAPPYPLVPGHMQQSDRDDARDARACRRRRLPRF